MENALFKIYRDGKWGFMNKGGDEVIKPQFLEVRNFKGRIASARDFDGKWGFINALGEWVVNPAYDHINSTSSKHAVVFIDDHFYCINLESKGKIEFKLPDDYLTALSSYFCDDHLMLEIDGKFYLLNQYGDIDLELPVDEVSVFSEGLLPARRGDLWGYIDLEGKWVIQPIFKLADSFSNGLASVTFVNKKKGYINKQGETCFSSRKWEDVNPFCNGLAIVWGEKPKTWGLIDKEGKYVLGPFSINEDCEILIRENKINLPGKKMVVCESETSFNDGLAHVELDGKSCFIDSDAELIFITPYDVWYAGYENGLCSVGLDDGWGYMDKSGRLVWEYHESITVSATEECTLPDDDMDTFPIFAKYEELPEYLKSHISKETFSKRTVINLEVCVGGDRQGLLSMANTLTILANNKQNDHAHMVETFKKKSVGLVFLNN